MDSIDRDDWMEGKAARERRMAEFRPKPNQEGRYVACVLAGVVTAFIIAQYL